MAYSKKTTWSDDQVSIINQILAQYNGYPAKAFAENPGWKEILESNHTRGAIYGKLALERKRYINGKTRLPVKAQRPIYTEDTIEVAPKRPERAILCCPKCGHNIQKHEMLSEFAENMSVEEIAAFLNAMKGTPLFRK